MTDYDISALNAEFAEFRSTASPHVLPAGMEQARATVRHPSPDDSCTPAWNGSEAIDDSGVADRISALTDTGGEVRVSFGGASGTELAAACDSASALAKAYGQALDAAGATRADFDIEGTALTKSAEVKRRSQAIALLQKERPDLQVSFTVPVMLLADTDPLAPRIVRSPDRRSASTLPNRFSMS